LQLLIFRQDAPLISPHPTHLVAEPYRASGLVHGLFATGAGRQQNQAMCAVPQKRKSRRASGSDEDLDARQGFEPFRSAEAYD
jgi:hypothetical protein